MLIEEQALDSMANILYSIILFWRMTGSWPEKVSVVSHEFKRARFLELHFPALRFPREKVQFVGIDPEYMVHENEAYDEARTQDVRVGEKERGYREWDIDMLGKGERLSGKRARRNFWQVGQSLFVSDEERERSGVKTEKVEWRDEEGRDVIEEVLTDVRQPWESKVL